MKLLDAFDELVHTFKPHFKRVESFERARTLAFASVVTYGRHTISRLISSKNEQQRDWSADYKFFSLREWDTQALFFEIFKACEPYHEWPDDAVLTTLDASVRKKTGKKIPGVRTLRDPMSLPYHSNLMKGLRYLQGSVVVAPERRLHYHRTIPIYFETIPPAKKPSKNASDEAKEQYKKEQKAASQSVRGQQAALAIRKQVDQLPNGRNRLLFVTVDGGFCNRTFLRALPENIIAIARARKDLKLFEPVSDSPLPGKGRKRIYGAHLPTPEQIRKDDQTYPWHPTIIYGAGKYHTLRYKTVAPVLWQKGTASQPMRLIVIAPLRYRKSKGSKLLYRDPAYLLVPDIETPVEQLIQFYFLHWGIEVNHRDEKSLLGLYDAQVRSEESVVRNPKFTVAVYSALQLAALQAYGDKRTDDYLPLPKWYKNCDRRASILDIIAQFRREVLIAQLQKDLEDNIELKRKKKRKRKRPQSKIEAKKRGFINDDKQQQNAFKWPVNIISAMLYADA